MLLCSEMPEKQQTDICKRVNGDSNFSRLNVPLRPVKKKEKQKKPITVASW